MSDAELLTGMRKRDRVAISLFYDRHGTLAFSLLLYITRNQELAESLLEEFFLKLPVLISNYQADCCTLSAWMILQARNVGVNYLRLRSRLPGVMENHDSGKLLEDELSACLNAVAKARNLPKAHAR